MYEDIPILFMTARDDFASGRTLTVGSFKMDADTASDLRNVDVYMTRLCGKLSECDDFGIVTVHRLGYKAVTDGSRRLTDLMTNILKPNRLENQQIYPQVEKYDLGEQLCECLLQYENTWEKAEIDIDTDTADNIIVKADRELLALVKRVLDIMCGEIGVESVYSKGSIFTIKNSEVMI